MGYTLYFRFTDIIQLNHTAFHRKGTWLLIFVKHKLIYFIFYLCMCVGGNVCTFDCRCRQCLKFPWSRSYSEPDVYPGNQTQVLCKHSTHSIAKPFLQPLTSVNYYSLYLNAYLLLNVWENIEFSLFYLKFLHLFSISCFNHLLCLPLFR